VFHRRPLPSCCFDSQSCATSFEHRRGAGSTVIRDVSADESDARVHETRTRCPLRRTSAREGRAQSVLVGRTTRRPPSRRSAIAIA
jgi:hypothetical protein